MSKHPQRRSYWRLIAAGFFFLVMAHQALAQSDAEQRIYQLTGIVLDRATNEPVPFAVIQVNNTRRRAICNENGFFSIPVVGTDTLNFFSLAYYGNRLYMAEFMKEYEVDTTTTYLYVNHFMIQDEIELPEVKVFPFNTPEEIRLAMVNMPMDENSPAALAARNVSPEMLSYMAENLPVDEVQRQAAATQLYYLRYQYQNRLQTAGIFDPIAVYQLVNYFSKKSKQKREKTYNYWPEDH